MTFSLLGILGGAANVASFTGKGEQEATALTQGQDTQLFENIIQGQTAISPALAAQQALLAKAQTQGITLLSPALAPLSEAAQDQLSSGLMSAGEQALAFLQNLMQRAGQNLPEGAKIPQWFKDRMAQGEGAEPLSAQELSELSAETGLPSALLLAAVENTPLANPALAESLTGDDVAQATDFLRNALAAAPKAVAENNGQENNAVPRADAQAAADAEADARVQAGFEKLLAKLAQLPQGDSGEKSAYAELAQFIQDAKSARKPAQTHDQQRAVATQTQQEKVAEPVVTAGLAEEFENTAADEAGEVKAPSQQGASAISSRNEGVANPSLQVIAGQEAKAEHQAKAGAEQTRLLPQRTVEAPLQEVTVHIAKAVKDGVQRLEVQLRPEALGKIEISIETDKDGQSRVQITAEKRDTLDLFQRDAKNLERVLQDAGLKTDNSQLSFNLRGGDSQQGRGNEAQQHDKADDSFARVLNGDDVSEDKRASSEMALGYDAGRHYRLDMDWGVDISV